MTQRAYSIFIFFIALLVLVSPFFISAQEQFAGDDNDPGIVPCGDTGSNNPCNACDLVELTQGIVNFTMYLAIFVATLMFVYAGILYLSALGSTEKITKATDIFTRVLIGFIIVLIAWLVIDIIMKEFLSDEYKKSFGPWNKVTCTETVSSTLKVDSTTDAGVVVATKEPSSHQKALAQLTSEGVSVTSTSGPSGVKENCPTGKGCTTLSGVQQATLDQIVSIKKSCTGCEVVVVGATEPGHAPGSLSHANGYKIDIDDENEPLNNFLVSNLVEGSTRTDGSKVYLDSCGNEYAKEDSHWDITVKSVCSI